MTAVDGAWYERQVTYVIRNSFQPDELRWNHVQFLKDCPARRGRLLDVGCGTGRFLAAAQGHGYRVAGIDWDSHAVKVARDRFALDDVHVADADAAAQIYGDSSFDVVTAFEVLEHSPDPPAFVTSVNRLIAPKGFLALSVPYRDRWPRVEFRWDRPPHHLTQWSRASIEKFLSLHGFDLLALRIGWAQGEALLHEFLQFRVAARLVRIALADTSGQTATVNDVRARMAGELVVVKHHLIKLMALPVNLALSAIGATGMDMYVLAQKTEGRDESSWNG